MLYEKTISFEDYKQDKPNILGRQLGISLKFHHSNILQKLSQEAALQAMVEAWQSCHSKQTYECSSKDFTITVPSQEMANILECRNLL
ncbi:hypothetical protein [Acaryochloris marina]|uniref:Uncharacterized protein n=1 Tax=Acaryochloris marina (strain MBIC 11017) TaxID=329726 RepID=A8ZQN1_ACAM1|nr:hypothetical protein [Acaryochloris marina]ABW33317.1 hypothetical protein AM1_G0137 [Acaryochloris marina MBIC11017]